MIKNTLAFCVLSALWLTGCRKADDPNVLRDDALKQNIWELMNNNPDYTAFAKLVKETGYDSLLNSSKVYTVFAPSNEAIQLMDPSYISTPALKKRFVANHIAASIQNIQAGIGTVQLEMLNGKLTLVTSTKIDIIPFKKTNAYAANGVVHVLNGVVNTYDNIWEYLIGPKSPAKQKAFLNSLFGNVFDLTNAVVVGVNPTTGENIYKAGTDSVYANLYLRRVYDLRNEKKQYTMFVPEDAAWDAENATYKPYYTASTADSTNFATAWNVYRDLVIDSLIEPTKLPDTVVTKFGAKIPVNKSNIAASIKMSNGYVYVMRSLATPPVAKFATRIIEGENYNAYSVNRLSNTYIRDRFNDVTSKNFRDILVLNHGVALFNLRYDIGEVPNIKYKAYWVAVNDFQTAAYQQRLGIGSPLSTLLPYINVAANVKTEVYLGEFTAGRYLPVMNLYLTAANSTANASNPLVCDYIKLVPSL